MSTATTHPAWCQSDHDRGDPVHYAEVDLGGGATVFVAARPEDGGRVAIYLTDASDHSVELDADQTARLLVV